MSGISHGYIRGKRVEIELVPIPGSTKEKPLELAKDAAQAFHAMYTAAKADGIELKVNSAFRPHLKQQFLYDRYVSDLAAFNQGEGPKPLPVGKPGWSKHESGMAVDIQRAHDPKVDAWLAAHAGEYKFVRTVASEMHHCATGLCHDLATQTRNSHL